METLSFCCCCCCRRYAFVIRLYTAWVTRMSPTSMEWNKWEQRSQQSLCVYFVISKQMWKKYATYSTPAVISRKIMYYLFNYKSRISELINHTLSRTPTWLQIWKQQIQFRPTLVSKRARHWPHRRYHGHHRLHQQRTANPRNQVKHPNKRQNYS